MGIMTIISKEYHINSFALNNKVRESFEVFLYVWKRVHLLSEWKESITTYYIMVKIDAKKWIDEGFLRLEGMCSFWPSTNYWFSIVKKVEAI